MASVGVMGAEACRLVAADIADGVVPGDVADFAGLHEYVDANTYLLDVMPPMPFGDSGSGEPAPAEYVAWFDTADKVADVVDGWLAAGRPSGG